MNLVSLWSREYCDRDDVGATRKCAKLIVKGRVASCSDIVKMMSLEGRDVNKAGQQ
jgi:hypothetical protein